MGKPYDPTDSANNHLTIPNVAMTNNPYESPKSNLISANEDEQPMFFVVSITKLIVMSVATIGLYGFYWIYANWRNYRRATGQSILAVVRAIFSIFFMHSLFRKVNERLVEKNIEHKWSPMGWATTYVVVVLISAFSGYIPGVSEFISFALLPLQIYVLVVAQKAVNRAENDPSGSANDSLTAANWAWIAIGALYWIMMLALLAVGFGWFEYPL